MNRLDELAQRRKAAHARLLELDSTVCRAFLDMERAAFSGAALPRKVKELIATGISAVINFESCMQWHIEQAKQAGAAQQEVLEALKVAMEMGGGPATVSARFALEVLEKAYAG